RGARRTGFGSVAARDDGRRPALALEVLGDPEGERGLAAAAGDEIADDDHCNARMAARQEAQPIKQPAQRDREAEEHARRPQRPGEQAAGVPVAHYEARITSRLAS